MTGSMLQESLVGTQCSPVLAEQKSEGGQQQTSAGFLHHVDGCEGSAEVTLNPSYSFPVIHSFDVHTSHSLTSLSDLLPFFSLHWRVSSFRLSPPPLTLRRSICKHMHTYASVITRTRAKHHTITSRVLSETCVLGGKSLDL